MSWMSRAYAYQQENPELSTEEVMAHFAAISGGGKHRATIEFPKNIWDSIISAAHQYEMSSSEFIRLCMRDAVSESTMHQIPWIKSRDDYAQGALEAAGNPRSMKLVQYVRSRVDIVDVISGYTPLQKSGRNFKADCPFLVGNKIKRGRADDRVACHKDGDTPSFMVFPDKKTWRCFGDCAMGGDVIAFLMRAQNKSFVDVLNSLEQCVGKE